VQQKDSKIEIQGLNTIETNVHTIENLRERKRVCGTSGAAGTMLVCTASGIAEAVGF
jgi:hypothetical protein